MLLEYSINVKNFRTMCAFPNITVFFCIAMISWYFWCFPCSTEAPIIIGIIVARTFHIRTPLAYCGPSCACPTFLAGVRHLMCLLSSKWRTLYTLLSRSIYSVSANTVHPTVMWVNVSSNFWQFLHLPFPWVWCIIVAIALIVNFWSCPAIIRL